MGTGCRAREANKGARTGAWAVAEGLGRRAADVGPAVEPCTWPS